MVESHVIDMDVYHEELLELMADQDIPALMGSVTPRRFGKDCTYISTSCETVIFAIYQNLIVHCLCSSNMSTPEVPDGRMVRTGISRA